MHCLCSSFINYRLLSLREILINSGICVTDLTGPHLLAVASVGGGKYFNPVFSRHLHVSRRSSRKEICSLRESILSSCWREWDKRLMGSAPTSSGADGMRLWKGASTNWSFCREMWSCQHVPPATRTTRQDAAHGALVAFKGPGGVDELLRGRCRQRGAQLGSLRHEASRTLKIKPGCSETPVVQRWGGSRAQP